MFFWFGLAGIIATGFMLALGGDYWALAGHLQFSRYSSRTLGVLVALTGLVGVFDICALGVILAGSVIIIQRLRGRI
jgi:hypothetical protein